ncbi:hypothetical protein LINPERHAP1_LOCUS37428 [Linum perenne]
MVGFQSMQTGTLFNQLFSGDLRIMSIVTSKKSMHLAFVRMNVLRWCTAPVQQHIRDQIGAVQYGADLRAS